MREIKQENFAQRIRELRLEHGMTQEDVARWIGVSRGCMANYETGKRRPDALIVRRLSKLLGVSTDFLLGVTQIRSYTLSETVMNDFAQAWDETEKYGDVLHLGEMDSVSRMEILDYYEYLKQHPRRKRASSKKIL